MIPPRARVPVVRIAQSRLRFEETRSLAKASSSSNGSRQSLLKLFEEVWATRPMASKQEACMRKCRTPHKWTLVFILCVLNERVTTSLHLLENFSMVGSWQCKLVPLNTSRFAQGRASSPQQAVFPLMNDQCDSFIQVLGPPVVPFYPLLGEGSSTNIDYRKKGSRPIPTSLLKDVGLVFVWCGQIRCFKHATDPLKTRRTIAGTRIEPMDGRGRFAELSLMDLPFWLTSLEK